jgi:hypothetical protein
MMWGDMLLAPEQYPGFNATHALRGTERAIKDLSREIIITDWHYGGNDQFPSARYFQQQGFEVIGCPWNSEQGILNWGEQLAADDALGLLGTSWHKLTDILGTIALVSEAAWNSDGAREVAESYDTSAFVVGSLERLMSEDTEFTGEFRPIDLSAHANVAFRDQEAADGRGWLDFGPLRDLRNLQPGRHTFAGVPFEVAAGEANAIMLRSPLPPCDNLPRQREGIPVEVGARRLHLLTGYGFHVQGRAKVLTVRLNYATGEPDDVRLQAGRDIFHWLAEGLPAAGRGEHQTTVAWRGRTRDGTPVRLCALAIDVDDQRDLESIDLLSHDTEAAPFVAALTVEHAGD